LLDFGLFDGAVFTHLLNTLTVLLRYHLLVLHFFHFFAHFLIVPLFELEDFACAFASLLDFFPGLHFFLLK